MQILQITHSSKRGDRNSPYLFFLHFIHPSFFTQLIPNLFIVGYYHHGITARVSKSGIEYKNSAGNAAEIESKYGANNLYGLNPDSQEDIQFKIRPHLVKRMHFKLFS